MEIAFITCVYVQLRDCADTFALDTVVNQLSLLGKVGSRGIGPATDPKGGWVELQLRSGAGYLSEVYAALQRVGVPLDIVTRVTPIQFGHGHAEARQLSLFGSGQ